MKYKNILFSLAACFISYSSFAATPLKCAQDSTGSFFGTLRAADVAFPLYARELDIFNPPYGGVLNYFYHTTKGDAAISPPLAVKCTENPDGSLTETMTQQNDSSHYLIATMSPDHPAVWQITQSQIALMDGTVHNFTGTLTSWNDAKK